MEESHLIEQFESLIQRVTSEVVAFYGERLVSLAVYGSVARGGMRADSDLDFLVIAEPLPSGRMPRVREFQTVDAAMSAVLSDMKKVGINTYLSPIFRTPSEIRAHPPLLLDMTEDARILFDRAGFFGAQLQEVRQRLTELGAKRHFRGAMWWWDLKPDFKHGELVSI